MSMKKWPNVGDKQRRRSHAAEQKAQVLSVVQAANLPSLLNRSGYIPFRSDLWFHLALEEKTT